MTFEKKTDDEILIEFEDLIKKAYSEPTKKEVFYMSIEQKKKFDEWFKKLNE